MRALLFRCALVLVAKNPEMKALHHYFITRQENPLKKMQSMIAICGKLIRILFTLGRKQCSYEADQSTGRGALTANPEGSLTTGTSEISKLNRH